MQNWMRDFRLSFRLLRRRPGFTAVAVVSLALGIGANTAIFSIVNELFLRPIPVGNPSEVVAIYSTDRKIPGLSGISHLNWQDFRDQNEVFSDFMGYDWAPMSVTAAGESIYLFGQLVSGNYFEGLGVRAQLGRTFLAQEDATPGTHPVTVLSHQFWVQQLGADPEVIGRGIRINSQPFTVIGVASPEFKGTNIGLRPELWVPMMMNRQIASNQEFNFYDDRRTQAVMALARLKPGVSISEARSQMQLIAERLEREYPDENRGRSVELLPLAQATIFPGLRENVMGGTALLMAAVGLVLLIACANVANLMLGRAAERRREIAVRLSIGAGRAQLVRQFLAESLTIAFLGGLLGLMVALWTRSILLVFLPQLPFISLNLEFGFDPQVMAFSLALTVFTGCLFGLLPAMQSSRPNLVSALKGQNDLTLGRNRRLNARNGLVVLQVSLSLIALAGAGLFVRSLGAAQQVDPGFESDRLLVLSFDVGLQGYDQPQGEQFFHQVTERVSRLPQVVSASVALAGPFQGSMGRSVFLEGGSSQDERTFVAVNTIGPGYFETMGIPLIKGRRFTPEDRKDSRPVVIVNQTMAEKFWPGQEPIGKRFHFFGEAPVEVVGVARDIKYHNLGESPLSFAYEPLAQRYLPSLTLLARTQSDPSSVLPLVQQQIRALDPELPLAGVNTVSQLLSEALWAPRFAASLLAVFGMLALALAAVGLYGVVSFSVQRRTREIGIRMALGAQRGGVVKMILRQGMGLVLVGIGIGLLAALGFSRILSAFLFVSPSDPIAFAVTFVALLLVAGLACFIPAGRAAGVDPIRVLRCE